MDAVYHNPPVQRYPIMQVLRVFHQLRYLQHNYSKTVGTYTSGNRSFENTIKLHVFPTAPSPTITNFFRIIANYEIYGLFAKNILF